jgi:hypothetical protein
MTIIHQSGFVALIDFGWQNDCACFSFKTLSYLRCFAVQGGYNGLVCYEVEQEAPERGSFVFCFECNKQGVKAIVGEPREEPAVRYGLDAIVTIS